jgi:hypothetical protein
MDCDQFESAMMDVLYGEIDAAKRAAARDHTAICATCAARLRGLRASRRVASVPLALSSDGLEQAIVAPAGHAHDLGSPFRPRSGEAGDVHSSFRPRSGGAGDVPSLRQRTARVVSLAGSWAMRPQTAMSAVFLVMIGTSVLLLRGKAHAPTEASVTVTQQGTPALPVASASQKPIEPPSPFEAAAIQYRAGQFDEAMRAFDTLAASDPNAELWASRAARAGKGCRAAVTRFDHLAQRAAGTPVGWDALLEGGICFRSIGNASEARVRLNALLRVDSHKERAHTELERLRKD